MRRSAVVGLLEFDGSGVESGLGDGVDTVDQVHAQVDDGGRLADLDGRSVTAAASASGQGREGQQAEGPGEVAGGGGGGGGGGTVSATLTAFTTDGAFVSFSDNTVPPTSTPQTR